MAGKIASRTLAAAAVALIVGAAAAGSCDTTMSGQAGGSTMTSQETVEGAMNYTRVDATIACGGATSPEAMTGLKALGFNSVINLREAGEDGVELDASRAAAEAAGLRYVHVPFASASPDPAAVTAFLDVASDASVYPAYVHCSGGNRAGMMLMAKRMAVDGWDAERAEEEARLAGLRSDQLRDFVIEYMASHPR